MSRARIPSDDVYTPDTIPMARLATSTWTKPPSYLVKLTMFTLLGLRKADLQQDVKVGFEAVPKVEDRMTKARRSEGPAEAIQAIKNINRMLRDDNGVGFVARKRGTTIVKFRGREEKPVSFGFIAQEGNLDGVVNVVGGDGDPPVHSSRRTTDKLICATPIEPSRKNWRKTCSMSKSESKV